MNVDVVDGLSMVEVKASSPPLPVGDRLTSPLNAEVANGTVPISVIELPEAAKVEVAAAPLLL